MHIGTPDELSVDGNTISLSPERMVDVKSQLDNIYRGTGVGILTITSDAGTRTVYVNQSSRIFVWENAR